MRNLPMSCSSALSSSKNFLPLALVSNEIEKTELKEYISAENICRRMKALESDFVLEYRNDKKNR